MRKTREDIGEIIGGYRTSTDSSYSFSVFLINGKFCFQEEYSYYGDNDREYVYALIIPASQRDSLFSLLQQRCTTRQTSKPPKDKNVLLYMLLQQLTAQGAFKDAQSVAPKENLMTIHAWLEEEDIPHERPHLVY
jgi:hypothetical protein